MSWCRMLFLGDSLTSGARNPHGLSWPYYLAHRAAADAYVILPVVDAAPGGTSADLVRRALPSIEQSTAKEAFILIGTNDAKHPVPPDVYVRNVELVTKWCSVFGIRPYVLTIPRPCGFGSPGYDAGVVGVIQQYNEKLRGRGFEHIIECSGVSDTVDGIHLSVEGAEEVARLAWQAVKRVRTFT